MKNIVKIIHRQKVFLLLIFTLILAAYLRYNTFWDGHTSGDEFHYVALAMKLEHAGMDGYNIRHVDYETFTLDGKFAITEIMYADSTRGRLLDNMYQNGRGYYDNPLYNNSPLLSWLLMQSKKIIGGDYGYFISGSHLGKRAKSLRPESVFRAQLYATIIPFVVSLLLILMTFFLGRSLFSPAIGLLGAFFIAVDPVSMLSASKIWADELSALFVVSSALAFWKAYSSKSFVFGLMAGVLAGLALLSKQTAGFFVIGVMLFHFWDSRNEMNRFKGWLKIIFHPVMISMAVGLLAVSGFWFYENYQVYGEFIHKHLPGPGVKDYFYFLKNQRPPAIFIYGIGLPILMPFFGLAFLTFFKFFRNQMDHLTRRKLNFLWFWVLAYFVLLVVFFNGREHRFFIAAHPALALLSANVLLSFYRYLKRYKNQLKWFSPEIIAAIIIIVVARFTAGLGLEVVYSGAVMILFPF